MCSLDRPSFFVGRSTFGQDVKELQEIHREQLEERIVAHLERLNVIPEHMNRSINQHFVDYDWSQAVIPDLQRMLFQRLRSTDAIDAIYFGGEDDEFVGYARFGQVIELMICGAETNGAIRFYTVDDNGEALSLIREKADFIVPQRPWYLDAVAEGDHVWGRTFTYHAFPTLRAAPTSMPLYVKGELVGVVGNNFFMNSYSRFLKSLETSEKDRFYIVDEDGKVIASNIFDDYEYSLEPKSAISDLQDIDDNLTQAIFAAIEGVSFTDHMASINLVDHDSSVDIIQIEIEGLPSWRIVLYTPNDGMLGLFENYFTTILGFTILVAICVFCLMLALTKLLTRPIQDMAQLAQKMARLEFGERIAYVAHDEVGDLAQSLNTLSDNLQA